MMQSFRNLGNKLKAHLHAMLSGRYQTLSTGRVLSFSFAIFSVVVLSIVLHRMLEIKDPALLHEWVGALPSVCSICFGLVGLPYSATKFSGSLTDLITSIRKRGE